MGCIGQVGATLLKLINGAAGRQKTQAQVALVGILTKACFV
jgi:hypothetical protein